MADTDISLLDHCTGRQLKELLALAATGEKTAHDWLLEVGDLERLECLLTEMSTGAEQPAAALLRAACSAETPVDDLAAIKRRAKRLAAAAEVPAQKAAATLLYHLTVASALAHHAQNISSRDPAERLPLYKDLAAELSDDELAAIFAKAMISWSPAGP